jgi:hypothetical protein
MAWVTLPETTASMGYDSAASQHLGPARLCRDEMNKQIKWNTKRSVIEKYTFVSFIPF